MKAAGIICEFDPFHSGHQYLIDKVRKELDPDAVVCVMSGAFTQRGAPAMWDKFSRAAAAVRCGADLVLELPAYYALSSARYFAGGGISVLSGLGCVSHLAFGSECGDSERLLNAAGTLNTESPEFSGSVKELMSEGKSFPEAYQLACASYGEAFDPDILGGPNDMLGISYIRAIIDQNSDIKPFVIKRAGAGHNEEASDGGFTSASAIRKALSNEASDAGTKRAASVKSVPERAAEELDREESLAFPDEARLFAMVMEKLLTADAEELAKAPEVSEGLENRLKEAALSAGSIKELVLLAKTRRYTYARLSRVLMQLLLGMDGKVLAVAHKSSAAYAKVLAFNETGGKILKYAKEHGSIPVVSNINKTVMDSDILQRMLKMDILSNDIYTILCGKPVSEFSDKVRVPIIMTN